MTTPNLSELITTTLRNREKKVVDNITNKNALLRRLRKKNKIKIVKDGGRTLVKPLHYAENGTFKRYSGYETLDIAASDVISAAEYNWKQAAVVVTIDGLTRRQNTGKSQIINLLSERIENALMTFDNNISTDIYSAGTADSSKQIGGLQSLIADAPTSGTVGGIDRQSYSFWQNYKYDASSDGGAAADATNIQTYMNQVWLNTLRGGDKVDMILADNNYWLHYLNSLQAIQRITSVGGADPGTDASDGALKFFSADVIPDGGSGIPTNHMYFVNSDYITFEIHSDANFSPMDERMSVNQDATVVPILFMGNLTMSNAARQGVLIA